ncbi:NUDIX hydrolase [Helicobacter sp. 12S02634-8]|uniref:NUDIX domain-containing protein n=1 Tax=Helicobacter sp. 12S02634-8 TaxID=1476199 RepID=UPI000BA79BCB|nr:NUDIX domain-containing protein [Helicobacter sp. 12S02634-8]PAF48536.1 NUDIX hydrolase [Helicobacter sp. 12S02634-8]
MDYFPKICSKVDFDSMYFEPCEHSVYIKPKRIHYRENGKDKVWDIVSSHDSVSILLYHLEFDSFLVVRQFRPAVYLSNQDGYTYELCAGLVDKEGKSLEEIASEEVLEECGYGVEALKIQKIATFYTSTGISGSRQTLFFASISEKDKRTAGGGIDDECIEVLFLPVSRAFEFINDEKMAKTTGLSYAIIWYMDKFLQRNK